MRKTKKTKALSRIFYLLSVFLVGMLAAVEGLLGFFMDNKTVVYILLDADVAASGSLGMMEDVFDSLSGKNHIGNPDGFSDYLSAISGGLAQHNPDISVYIDTPLSIAKKKETGDFEIIKKGAIGSFFNIQLHQHASGKSSGIPA